MVALRDNKEPSRRECTYKIQVTFLKTKPVLSLAANRGWDIMRDSGSSGTEA